VGGGENAQKSSKSRKGRAGRRKQSVSLFLDGRVGEKTHIISAIVAEALGCWDMAVCPFVVEREREKTRGRWKRREKEGERARRTTAEGGGRMGVDSGTGETARTPDEASEGAVFSRLVLLLMPLLLLCFVSLSLSVLRLRLLCSDRLAERLRRTSVSKMGRGGREKGADEKSEGDGKGGQRERARGSERKGSRTAEREQPCWAKRKGERRKNSEK
jgi:hypothetical protein